MKALLKDKKYIYFAYMTGILPIAKYTSGSPLNMFHEFSSFQDDAFSDYFRVTDGEISELYQKHGSVKLSREDLKMWYDGYMSSLGDVHIYNPASVIRALATGVCRNYWTGTGPMNEVRDIIRTAHEKAVRLINEHADEMHEAAALLLENARLL